MAEQDFNSALLEQQNQIVAAAVRECNVLRGRIRQLEAEAQGFPGAMWELQERVEMQRQQIAALKADAITAGHTSKGTP